MSKEYLEVKPEDIANLLYEVYDVPNGICEQIKDMVQRLESIDNSNPSEALKELDEIIEYITEDKKVKYKATILFDCEIIKNALLKAQEPKHYLKWEDLEFEIENQEMFVLLNGSYYLLEYYTDSEEEFVFIKATHTTVFELLGERSDDKQFFNDLHLERVARMTGQEALKVVEKDCEDLEQVPLGIIKRFIWVEDDKLMCGRYGDVEIELDESDFEDEEELNLLKEVLK